MPRSDALTETLQEVVLFLQLRLFSLFALKLQNVKTKPSVESHQSSLQALSLSQTLCVEHL